MNKKPPKPQMEQISPETWAKLLAIQTRIDEYKAKIKELENEADDLVPKHTFEECKAMECVHTHQNRWDCHCYCVRRKGYSGCFHDYYSPKKKVFKPKVTYPVLGWKSVACKGSFWKNEWHPYKVVKETEKTLVLDDGTQLFKSTLFTIEDCTYIKCRSGYTYFCADDPSVLDTFKMLLDVVAKERSEKFNAEVRKMLKEPPDCTLPWEKSDEKIFNPIP